MTHTPLITSLFWWLTALVVTSKLDQRYTVHVKTNLTTKLYHEYGVKHIKHPLTQNLNINKKALVHLHELIKWVCVLWQQVSRSCLCECDTALMLKRTQPTCWSRNRPAIPHSFDKQLCDRLISPPQTELAINRNEFASVSPVSTRKASWRPVAVYYEDGLLASRVKDRIANRAYLTSIDALLFICSSCTYCAKMELRAAAAFQFGNVSGDCSSHGNLDDASIRWRTADNRSWWKCQRIVIGRRNLNKYNGRCDIGWAIVCFASVWQTYLHVGVSNLWALRIGLYSVVQKARSAHIFASVFQTP